MEGTKLQQFMEANNITDADIARESAGRISARHVAYVKSSEREPTRPVMVAIMTACRKLVRRRIAITDLFDFEKTA